MLSVNTNGNLLMRSLSLAKVLWFGVAWMRVSFVAVCCLWALVFLVDYVTTSAQVVAFVMIPPIMLQTLLAMYIAMRAIQILTNPQLHLVGLRKELFLNFFVVCVLFTLFVFDPKNPGNFLNAKLFVFPLISVLILWLCWACCLQVVPMLIGTVLKISGFVLFFVINARVALVFFNVAIWMYFAYWFWRSPLQRKFTLEIFSGWVDYSLEGLNINFIRRALTQVKKKEHVLLMSEGDGYFNRILLAPIFTLVLSFFFIVFMHSMTGLSLWMVLIPLLGTKAKTNVIQSSSKLWLLSDNDRRGLFANAENIVLRLNLYPFITASLLLSIWLVINPTLLVHGFTALCLTLLFVIAVDYWVGMATPADKASMLISVVSKMMFIVVMINIHLDLGWSLLLAIMLFISCLSLRKRAQRNFLVANFSAANSSMRAF